jgi:Spy/CpxP family protein refolding chaperone
MTKTTSLLLAALVAGSVFSTSAMADAKKGQKYYLKKLKATCGFSGAKFAHKHTQDQWEELKNGGKLEDEIKAICPNVKDVKDKYLPDMFDFFHEYGSDSGNVPSC